MSLPSAGMGQIKRHLVLYQGMGDSLWPLFHGAEAGGGHAGGLAASPQQYAQSKDNPEHLQVTLPQAAPTQTEDRKCQDQQTPV